MGEHKPRYSSESSVPMNFYFQQVLQLIQNLQQVDKVNLLGVLANQITQEQAPQKAENSGHPKFGLAKGKFSYPNDIHLYDDEVATLFITAQ